MLTTAWDDTMTSHPDEIDIMEAEHKARRSQIPRSKFWVRMMFWHLDRTFFKGVRNGQTMTEARENAIDKFGTLKGLIFGSALTFCFYGVVSFYWSAASAGEWTNIILNTIVLIVAFLLASGLVVKGVRKIWRKVRHKES